MDGVEQDQPASMWSLILLYTLLSLYSVNKTHPLMIVIVTGFTTLPTVHHFDNSYVGKRPVV